jgi:hypothetical protein
VQLHTNDFRVSRREIYQEGRCRQGVDVGRGFLRFWSGFEDLEES